MHTAAPRAVQGQAMVLILGLCGLQPALGQAGPAPARPGKAAPGRTATYDQIIEKGYTALGRGQLAQAEALAQQALATPDRFEGHLLAGMVAFRNEDLAGAEAALARALALAPPEGKAKVTQAQGVLTRRKAFLEHRKAAEEAERNGLASKAAREYTAAWEADPGEDEIGLKAAKLWAERSSTPENAMPILGKLMENPKNFQVSDDARRIMEPLAARLAPLAAEELRKGFEELVHDMYGGFENAGGIPHFKKAAAMAPGDPLPRLRLAEAYAFQYFDWKDSTKPEGPATAERQRVAVSANLRAAFRCAGAMQPTEFLRLLSLRPQLLRTMRDPAFRELYSDAFGPTAAAQAAELQRARFDQALGQGPGTIVRFDGFTFVGQSTRDSALSTLDLTSRGFDLRIREFNQSSTYANGSRIWREKRETIRSSASVDFHKLLCVTLTDWDNGENGGMALFMGLAACETVAGTRIRYGDGKAVEERNTTNILTARVSSWPTRLLDAFRAAGIDVVDHSRR